jgi:hypothetical protein
MMRQINISSDVIVYSVQEFPPRLAILMLFPGNVRVIYTRMGHAVAQWLRHCATSRQVAGSIPDEVMF